MANYVWRVENRNGEGPYTSEDSCVYRMLREHSDNLEKWPTPHGEGIPIDGLLCGFRSKQQALSWFRGYWKELRRRGFRLKCLRASEIYYGKKQVTFRITR